MEQLWREGISKTKGLGEIKYVFHAAFMVRPSTHSVYVVTFAEYSGCPMLSLTHLLLLTSYW